MSTLKTNTIKNTDDVEMYLAKAWVNFNGTGTVAIRAAGNVSSITDGGVGIYTVNFTTAMLDANYAVTGAVGIGTNGGESLNPVTLTTASVQVDATINAAKVDRANINVAIFR